MTARTATAGADASPGRSVLRRVTFVLVTLAAFALDVLMTVPLGEELIDGHHFVAFGVWDASVVTFVALMALGYAVLLLRRRRPLAVLAWMVVLSVVLTFTASWSQPMTGVLVSLFTAASLAHGAWASRLALALGLGGMLTTSLVTMSPSSVPALFPTLVVCAVTFAVWLFGRREHLAQVTAEGLRDRLAEHAEEAARDERRRIARELHDILAHSVSAMMMQAAGARAVTHGVRQDAPEDPRLDTVHKALTTIENTGSQSMRELHRLLSAMRGDEVEADMGVGASSQPGLAEVERLAELTRESGLVVELHSSGEVVRLDPSVGLAAYRVVQEALANAMKHSGRGGVVDVFRSWHPDHLQLQVRTRDGHEGTLRSVHGSGTGLLGLRERVELMGGSFEFGTVGDEFVTTAVLPLTPRELRPQSDGPDAPDVRPAPAAPARSGRAGAVRPVRTRSGGGAA